MPGAGGDELRIHDQIMHIVLFPFPAQGHFSSFLSLADQLHRARPSATITLVATPCNVAALRASASTSLPFLRFHALPFAPEEHGLPPGGESADVVTHRHFLALFEATESPSFPDAFDNFLAAAVISAPPVVVIADPFLAWTTGATRRRGARHAIFVSCGAFGSAVYHSLWNHLPHQRRRGDPHEDDGSTFRLPDHQEVTVHRTQLPMHLLAADGTDPWSRYHRRQIDHAYDTHAVLVNTTEEFERTGLRMLQRTMGGGGVPVWPVGPLVRLPKQEPERPDGDDSAMMQWLDAREARSVLFVCFGSQNSLRPDQMMELAAALELTGRPFVWAIRPPVTRTEEDKRAATNSWLPEGFEERVRGGDTGLLIRGWAPQPRILAHASVGAFLSHCGWNSVLECVTRGVPILSWPLAGEQFHNANMLDEEWGVCVEVARGNDAGDSCVVDRARLAEAVETVLGDTAKGNQMRRRARELQVLVCGAQSQGGSSVQALEEFFTLMLRGGTTPANTC